MVTFWLVVLRLFSSVVVLPATLLKVPPCWFTVLVRPSTTAEVAALLAAFTWPLSRHPVIRAPYSSCGLANSALPLVTAPVLL